jgi:large subunit ribosomal protein L4
MKVDKFDKKGKKATSKTDLDKNVFGVDVNESLISQVIYVYQSNRRQANAHTKDRGEVRGGGKKPWRQKGTGRARHGSTRSPIWKGGGVTFGPTNDRNFKKSINKKMNKIAIKSAFSALAKENKIFVIDTIEPKKTKEIIGIIENTKIDGKITFIQKDEKGLYKSTKNLEGVSTKRVGELNVYEIMNSGNMIILEDALVEITNNWAK